MANSTLSSEEPDLSKEIDDANKRLPIDLSSHEMPLDMTVRSVALTLAQRHCGDTTVKEGNLYQQLKLDNKLLGPLTPAHVIYCALIFERYLWGEWSKDIAGTAMASTLDEIEAALRENVPPSRTHAGESPP